MLDKQDVICYNIVMKVGKDLRSADRRALGRGRTAPRPCRMAVLPESEGSGGMTANAPRIARSHQELRRGVSRAIMIFFDFLSAHVFRWTVCALARRVLAQDARAHGNQLQDCEDLPQTT
jgi:hypothetical protein